MQAECVLTISFGAGGNSLAFLGGGWAQSEPGFTWSIGAESHVMLPQVKGTAEYILTIDVIPFVHRPELPNQRLIVSVNGALVATTRLSRPTLLGYRIPARLARGCDRMLVTLQQPDVACPKDFGDSEDDRDLAFAVSEAKVYRVMDVDRAAPHRLPAGLMLNAASGEGPGFTEQSDLTQWATKLTGLTIPQIALKFESVGENCEFGLFQRRCGAEPLGLLRFSSTFMRNLIRGIANEFDAIGDVEDIDPRLEGARRKEYMIHEKKYGLVYHTFVYEGERTAWMMREQESARLKFLRRKFSEELHAAEKIFVYRFGGPVTEEEVLPLHMALNRYGPVTLLWVVPAEDHRPAGTVEVLMSGLLKGYIDRLAPSDNAHDLSFDGWLRVCANACALDRLSTSAAAADAKSGAEERDVKEGGAKERGAKDVGVEC